MDYLTWALAAAETLLKFLASNQGGLLIAFVAIAGLGWRLRCCERRHQEAEEYIDALTGVVIELHGALAQFTGRRVVDVESLAALLQRGRRGPALKYVTQPPPGGDRREAAGGQS